MKLWPKKLKELIEVCPQVALSNFLLAELATKAWSQLIKHKSGLTAIQGKIFFDLVVMLGQQF
ncbi:MAG: hypothetical protein M1388_01270 [Thaumarchaeota archaeon]|nr:hypothetical protein [Nitrososphaerota archaeon]